MSMVNPMADRVNDRPRALNDDGPDRPGSRSPRPSVERTPFAVEDMSGRAVTRLITGSVVPRPIAWVGTRSSDAVNNLAPFSFFNAVSNTPPQVMVSMSVRDGKEKDSLSNIRTIGCFSVSLVSRRLANRMNVTSAAVPPHVDEFALADLRVEECWDVDAPMVAESPVSMECVAERILPLGSGSEYYVMTLARVVRFHVEPSLLDEHSRIDQSAIDTVARMGGPTYAATTELFDMERP